MKTHPGEGVVKEEKFPNTRKPSHQWVSGEFWNLRGQHNWEGKKKKQKPNTCLITTASRELAQKLTTATSKWGLGREAQAALLRVRTRA